MRQPPLAHRLGDGAFIHFAKPLRQLRLAEPRPPRDLRHGQWLPPAFADQLVRSGDAFRSEEHTSELQSLMRISYAVFCLKTKKKIKRHQSKPHTRLSRQI